MEFYNESCRKIESLEFNSDTCTKSKPVFTISNNNCYIHIHNDINPETGLPIGGKYYYWSLGNLPILSKNRKKAVLQAISEFLQFYNNNL